MVSRSSFPDVVHYQEFRLALRSEGADRLVGRITESPAGESPEFAIRMPVAPADIEEALTTISYSSGKYLKRSGGSATVDPIVGIGERLFSELMRDSVAGRFLRQAQDSAERRYEGIRLRIASQDEVVLNLPWEFLFDNNQSSFLALSLRTPVIRQIAAKPARPLTLIKLPLRVLVAASDLTYFDANEEIAILQELATRTGQIQLTVMTNVKLDALHKALKRDPYDVLHFIGMGAYGLGYAQWSRNRPATPTTPHQGLLFNAAGASAPSTLENAEFVTTGPLIEALQQCPTLQLVVLNAGDSHLLAAELLPSVPAIIGIRNDVLGFTCRALAQGLYEGLTGGQPLEAAMTLGRQMIDRRYPGTREWGLPVFYLNAPDGELLREIPAAQTTDALALPAGDALTPSFAVTLPTTAATPQYSRDQRRLHSLIELEQRNLESLLAQQSTLGDATPEVILSQIHDTNAQLKQLTDQLTSLS